MVQMSKHSRVEAPTGLDLGAFPSGVRLYLYDFLGHLGLWALRATSRNMRRAMERHIRDMRILRFDRDSEPEPYVNARRWAFEAICAYARALTHINVVTPCAVGEAVSPTDVDLCAYDQRPCSVQVECKLVDLIGRNRNTLCDFRCSTGVGSSAVLAALARCVLLEELAMRGTRRELEDEAVVRSCLDILRGTRALQTLRSSNRSVDQQTRILDAACRHQLELKRLHVDRVSPDALLKFGALKNLRALQVWELNADAEPLLRAIASMAFLTTLQLGVTGAHASRSSDVVWSFPAGLKTLCLHLYGAVHAPTIRGSLPLLESFYTHALAPQAIAQILVLAPNLGSLLCHYKPAEFALLYTANDLYPSTLVGAQAPAYPTSDAIERAFSDQPNVGRHLHEIVLGKSWRLGNADHRSLRRVADGCPKLATLNVRCVHLKQSCIAYLIVKCRALCSLELICTTPVLETPEEFDTALGSGGGGGGGGEKETATSLETFYASACDHVVRCVAMPKLRYFETCVTGIYDLSPTFSRLSTAVNLCIGHSGRVHTPLVQFVWSSLVSAPVSRALQTLQLVGGVDYSDLFTHIAPACPALTSLGVRGAHSHLLTLLRTHTDWFPNLATLNYSGALDHDAKCITLRGLLFARPLLLNLRLERIPANQYHNVCFHLAPFHSVSPANPIQRNIVAQLT